ncbi:amidohydrolase family protein [Phenylobacterium sp.]|uniref:amidohydrolase family protein n=1 Tax=Phenylobacterium sp. TaxID=1871053 RepID=UPI00289E042C|nr:amidohydrolase family protein [Phenylobacterium sp.]
MGDCACGRIDVHSHFLPDVYGEALAKAGLTSLDGGMPIPAWSAAAAIEMMDRQQIDTAMVSLSSPSAHFLPQAERPALCRQVNAAGAALVRDYPGRFGFFASLPMPDVEAALAEIAYAFDRLGVDGVILETNSDGEYLGSPRFAPVFAELNRRGAVVFLHPTSPACFEQVGLGRPAPMLEFPLDTTRTIVDLLYSRTLQANPDLKVIVPHGGAALPALVARIAAFANLPFIAPRPASEEEVFETLRRLYYDVALSAHPVALEGLRRIAPITQILFGSDWPFTPEFGVARNLHQLTNDNGLSEADLQAIARTNAERVFPRLVQLSKG